MIIALDGTHSQISGFAQPAYPVEEPYTLSHENFLSFASRMLRHTLLNLIPTAIPACQMRHSFAALLRPAPTRPASSSAWRWRRRPARTAPRTSARLRKRLQTEREDIHANA